MFLEEDGGFNYKVQLLHSSTRWRDADTQGSKGTVVVYLWSELQKAWQKNGGLWLQMLTVTRLTWLKANAKAQQLKCSETVTRSTVSSLKQAHIFWRGLKQDTFDQILDVVC